MDVLKQPSGQEVTQKKTTYDWTYRYDGNQPHAPTHLGDRTFSYDANGNQLGWTHDQNGTRRTITWDDENRIREIKDNGHRLTYTYDASGQRLTKRGPQGETGYINQWFTLRNGEVGTKHVYAGTTRVVSKLVKQDKPNSKRKGRIVYEKDQYTYHPDHLGTSAYITHTNGQVYQHLEYFPFGETWVEEHSNKQRTPYLFTAKELDEASQLYYFGARYYDPRTSVWVSVDPILESYLPLRGKSSNKSLAGMGGVYNSKNFGLFSYSHNNSIKFNDPDGKEPKGFSLGVSGNAVVARGGINGTVLFDTTTFDLAWVNSVEGGVGFAAPAPYAADIFISYVWTDDSASVFDFGGKSVVGSASANIPLGPTFATAKPLSFNWNEDPSGGEYLSLFEDVSAGPSIHEAGVSLGLPGVDAGVSVGDSEVYNTSLVRDSANAIIKGVNSLRNWFGADPIDKIPDHNEAYDR